MPRRDGDDPSFIHANCLRPDGDQHKPRPSAFLYHHGRAHIEGMERRQFGSVGEVPVIGQGTWHLERGERDDAIAALRRGIDLG